ncbi:MAG: aspartyl protease family protein [bacterium]|nr:aspartyl protease family protein [bacterium]
MRKIFSTVVLGLFCAVAFGQQKPIQSIPFEVFGDHIFIKVKVDGSEPLDFIFDTGDGLTVIDTDIAESLKLDKDHDVKRTSASGSVTGALILHNVLEIGEMTVNDIEVYSLSLNHLERLIGRNVDGIIGFDLLDKHIVQIDYDRMEFEIYDNDTFEYSGDGIEFDLELTNFIPHIKCAVKLNNGEVLKGEYFVNTGAGTTVDFNTPFVNKHDIIDKTGEHYSYLTGGLGKGETKHYEGRVVEFKIKDVKFENMPVGISQAKHGIQHSKKVFGIIGNNVLRRFNIIFDYKNYKMYWEKNKFIDEAFHVNTTGFDVQMSEDLTRVLVHKTYEIGVAKEIGLKVDDEIISIDGTPVSEMKLPDIKKLINNEGGNFKMKIKRGGEEMEVDVERHDLI